MINIENLYQMTCFVNFEYFLWILFEKLTTITGHPCPVLPLLFECTLLPAWTFISISNFFSISSISFFCVKKFLSCSVSTNRTWMKWVSGAVIRIPHNLGEVIMPLRGVVKERVILEAVPLPSKCRVGVVEQIDGGVSGISETIQK